MVKRLLIGCLWVASSFAGEGMITVLEAPLFRKPDRYSEVIQYVHKGERVFIHPVVFNDRTKFSDLTESEAAKKRVQVPEDVFLSNKEIANYHDGMDYIPVKDNQGRDAWILRDHIYVWYEDGREFQQKQTVADNTDYRLLEPLPDGYPLYKYEKLRGAFNFSVGTPYNTNYPYNQKIVAESYGYQMELNAFLTKQMSNDKRGRWFIGGIATVRTVESTYILETRRSTEQWVRLGGGPLVTYDAWKTAEQRITLSTSLLLYPFTQVNVAQTEPDTGEEEFRNFWGWNFGSRLGVEYQRVKLIGELDLIAGVWGEAQTPMRLSARTGTNRPEWWSGGSNDSFNTDVTFTFAGLVGIQSTY